MKNRESQLQQASVKWFRYQFPKLSKMLIAVPNGSQRGKVTACILKAEGVVAGVADLLLLTPRGGFGCLCIEMKTDIGRQSELQQQWQTEAEKSGNKYVLCRNFDQFREEVIAYLNSGLVLNKEI